MVVVGGSRRWWSWVVVVGRYGQLAALFYTYLGVCVTVKKYEKNVYAELYLSPTILTLVNTKISQA